LLLANLDGDPSLEGIAAGQRHDADGSASAEPALGTEDLEEEIGEPARDAIDLGEFGRADDEIEAAHDAGNAVEIAQRLLDSGDDIEAGESTVPPRCGTCPERKSRFPVIWYGFIEP
jgi:hypothetical protein